MRRDAVEFLAATVLAALVAGCGARVAGEFDTAQTGGASGSGSGGRTTGGSGAGGTVGLPHGSGGSGGAEDAAPPTSSGPCPLAAPELLPISDRVDVVIDEQRCCVYVSTRAGQVRRYDLVTKNLDTLVEFDGALKGMDLSPDMNALLVANADADPHEPDARSRLHVVDLQRNEATTLTFALDRLESGTYMPLWLDTHTFLLTSSFAGSGNVPLRRVDARDGSFEVLRSVGQDTMLARSGDSTTVAYAESNTSGGAFGRYLATDGSFVTGQTDWFNYEIAVNSDATQFAVPVYDGLYVYRYENGFPLPQNLGKYASRWATGVAYAPSTPVLYVAWAQDDGGFIQAIDADTLEPLYTVDTTWVLSAGNYAFVSGRLRVSPSGAILAATISDGVKLYPTHGRGKD